MTARTWRRRGLAATLIGCTFLSGCLAALERGIDMIYSPEATSNLLGLPSSGLLQWAQFFAEWVRE